MCGLKWNQACQVSGNICLKLGKHHLKLASLHYIHRDDVLYKYKIDIHIYVYINRIYLLRLQTFTNMEPGTWKAMPKETSFSLIYPFTFRVDDSATSQVSLLDLSTPSFAKHLQSLLQAREPVISLNFFPVHEDFVLIKGPFVNTSDQRAATKNNVKKTLRHFEGADKGI